ncbi:riboflavin biosynthesis protein RibA [Chitinolyticbacter meiyuanensis]|uniref:riboflavin biosynthesis protein RibA n=1 Tax=Chitinolyticbacter meiyuanensis TaxID=682798 RepID=UPI0011E5FB71|nr:riboflavin biosynthesis protein RibA [Chitinolyticbacter meiyuanensis]
MLSEMISGEHARTKVAAVFDSQSGAEAAAEAVRVATGAQPEQVELVGPGDEQFGRKIEPESHGIVRTAIRAHLTMAVLGVTVGLVVYAGFFAVGERAILSSPIASAAVLAALGAIFGLLAGGLVTARPDHLAVVAPVRKAIRAGRWAVVVHPVSSRQTNEALRVLHRSSHEVLRTL